MSHVHETFEHNGHQIEIVHDDSADNPIKDEETVKVVEWTGSYDLGNCETFADPEEFEDFCKANKVHRLPLYLYDHSGLTVSTTPFGCQWDSGQVGWVFVTDEAAKTDLCPDDRDAKEHTYNGALEATVEELDTWLTGNVWGYVIKKLCPCCGEPRDVVDSCWGFYGDPDEDIRDEAMACVPEPDKPNPSVLAI